MEVDEVRYMADIDFSQFFERLIQETEIEIISNREYQAIFTEEVPNDAKITQGSIQAIKQLSETIHRLEHYMETKNTY